VCRLLVRWASAAQPTTRGPGLVDGAALVHPTRRSRTCRMHQSDVAVPPQEEGRAMWTRLLSIVGGMAVLAAGGALAQEVGRDLEDGAYRVIPGPHRPGRGGF